LTEYKLLSAFDQDDGGVLKAYYSDKKEKYAFTENDELIAEDVEFSDLMSLVSKIEAN
jgi:hypothetical protein